MELWRSGGGLRKLSPIIMSSFAPYRTLDIGDGKGHWVFRR